MNLVKQYGGADKLQEAVQHSPSLKAEIEAELAAIKGIHPERCVVTNEYRAALQRALS